MPYTSDIMNPGTPFEPEDSAAVFPAFAGFRLYSAKRLIGGSHRPYRSLEMKNHIRWIIRITLVYLLLVWLLAEVEGSPAGGMPARGTIHGFTDALWYSLVTMSTIGYGDMIPVTPLGRAIGLVFVFCSLGVLTAVIGLGLQIISGTLVPHLRLRLSRQRKWYVFHSCSADSIALAKALFGENSDCMLIFPKDGELPLPSERTVRLTVSLEMLIRLRKDAAGISVFYMDPDEGRNYMLASKAAAQGAEVYCMGSLHLQNPFRNLHFFSEPEAVSRRYWDTHPLSEKERCIVLIGCGQFGSALMERALINNVFITERKLEYHIFGDTELFRDRHPEILRALDSCSSGDRLFLHRERWSSDRGLLQRADRLILCSDDDGENLAAYDIISSWFARPSALHIRLRTALTGFPCFGDQFSILTPEYVIKDRLNRHAQMMNDIYNAGSQNPTPWHALSPFLRQSSIAAADHLLVKARYLLDNETLTELSDADCARAYKRYQELYPQRMDLLQEMEHRRWMRFYQVYNWQYAEKRDDALRLHPLLVPYSELSAEEKRKDRYAWEIFGEIARRVRLSSS